MYHRHMMMAFQDDRMDRVSRLSNRMSGYLVKRFDATDPYYDVRYHLSGTKPLELWEEYKGYMERIGEKYLCLSEFEDAICERYHVTVDHVTCHANSDREVPVIRGWAEFRLLE